MISAFYKYSPSKKEKITRQKYEYHPFIIPKQHLISNEEDIARLKKQCLSRDFLTYRLSPAIRVHTRAN
jgi:hypothetical protein